MSPPETGAPRPGDPARFIATIFALTIAVFLVLGIAFVAISTKFERLIARGNRDAAQIAELARFADKLLLFRHDVLLFDITADTALIDSARARLVQTRALLDGIRKSRDRGNDDELRFLAILVAFARFEMTLIATAEEPALRLRDDVNHVIATVEAHQAHLMTRIRQNGIEAAQLDSIMYLMILLSLTVLPAVLAFAGVSFWRRLARPLDNLNAAAHRLGAGDLAARAPTDTVGVIGGVINAFNSMADDLRRREEERRHFLNAVVHDLATPITVIAGGARLVMKRTTDDESRAWLERIQIQAERLAAMSGDLLESARIDAGQLRLEPATGDLASLVTAAVREERLIRGGRTINLELEAPCILVFDEKRIGRVLANLLSNAVKYSEPPAEVDVRLATTATEAIVTIVDRGAGLTAEEIAELFQPFARALRTARRKQGTGLGLFSVRKIMEAHGGRIELDSTPGQGTTVRVALPKQPA